MKTHPLRLVLIGGLAAILTTLAACGGAGSTGTSTSATTSATQTIASSAHAALHCTIQHAVNPIDSISDKLVCSVTNAPETATSFVVHYTLVDTQGQQHTLTPACGGSLAAGTGQCSETYSLTVPLANAQGNVSGTLQPGGQALGPVTPTLIVAPNSTPPTGIQTTTPLPKPKG